jgi:hypothetical protein
MALQKKGANTGSEGFSLRVKIGEYEVELRGTRQEVLETVEDLPDVIAKVEKAFERAKPETAIPITVKITEEKKTAKPSETPTQNLPKIAATQNADQAVLRILESDWGRWRPRTAEELKETLKTNSLQFSERELSSALDGLSKKVLLRRWDTNTGFVYILAEQKTVKSKGAR